MKLCIIQNKLIYDVMFLMLIDFKKTFDAIRWSFISKTIDLFNFKIE